MALTLQGSSFLSQDFNQYFVDEEEHFKRSSSGQDVLLIHSPGEKYTVEKGYDIPELTGENEILVKVFAIGLNPVDWKGP